jgi:hypothetical protein
MRTYPAIFAAVLLPSLTSADFHIGTQLILFGTAPDPPQLTRYLACPSNYYNCNCYGAYNSDRGVLTSNEQSPTSTTFSLQAGLCGLGQLNFYYIQDKGGWDFYVNGGDGSLQGTCYTNSASTQYCFGNLPLLSTSYTDSLVCYSYICNP